MFSINHYVVVVQYFCQQLHYDNLDLKYKNLIYSKKLICLNCEKLPPVQHNLKTSRFLYVNFYCIIVQVIIFFVKQRRSLFLSRKRSLPFLAVDATTGDQALSHDRCNIFPGLIYHKANNTFLNSLRKNDVEAQVEFTLRVLKRARVTCYRDVTVKKDSLLVYVLKCFRILEVGMVVEWQGSQRLGYKMSQFEVRVRPWITIFFIFNRNTLQKIGSDRLRKGKLQRRYWLQLNSTFP